MLMRMNKFLPFTIALLIHVLPLTYFLLQKRYFDTSQSGTTSSRPQGIDLSGFSTRRSASKGETAAAAIPATTKESTVTDKSSEPASGISSGVNPGPESAVSGTSKNSLVLTSVEPTYPPLARQKGLEGRVKLRAHYNTEGNITVVDIVESSGTKILDESARKALIAWKLKSGSEGSFEKTFQFKLN